MNFNQLRYFAETVRLGSYSAASKALFVTPPAISKAIADLETELKVKLLMRSGRNVGPTDFGRIFCEKAKEILSDISSLETMARSANESGQRKESLTIAIAISPYRSMVVKGDALSSLERSHSDVSISMIRCSSGTSLSAFEEGIVDAAIVLGRVARQDVVSTRILSLKPVLAVSKNHPIAQKEGGVTLDQIASLEIGRPSDLRYCYPLLLSELKKRDADPTFVDLISEQDHKDFVASGKGALFVTNDPEVTSIYPDAVFLPLDGVDARIPVHFVYHAGRNLYCMSAIQRHLKAQRRFIS